jgi:hypothetical protein
MADSVRPNDLTQSCTDEGIYDKKGNVSHRATNRTKTSCS